MPLCSDCQKIPAKFFSSARDTQCSIQHHETYLALRECAVLCRLCKLIIHAVNVYKGDYAWPKKWKEEDAVRLDSTKFGQQKVWIGGSEAGVFRGMEIPKHWVDPVPIREGLSHEEHLTDEAAIMKHWENTCSTTHRHCAELVKKGYLPTRLIGVDGVDSATAQLVETSTTEIKDVRYLALSHCWGKAMPDAARTTQATLPKHLESINISSLSKTFQDFIYIARRMKISWIWIDSLCIIQDSRDDWEHEAAQMASVYSNAHLTISASGSTDGRGGCKVLDSERSYGPVDSRFFEDPSSPEASKSRVFRIWARDPYPIVQVLMNDPINKRGWCLQERELSPRVVHFSKDSMRWECRDLKASLEFPWEDSITFNTAMRLFDNGQLDCPTLGRQSLGKLPMVEYNKAVMKQRLVWFNLVARYTNRALTKQTDVLPALSGIAQAIARSTNDEYLAGLWKSYLPYCLLWASAWHIDHGLATHSRPERYLAPSWSWASVKGRIEYIWWTVSWYAYNPNPDPAYVPNILSIEIQPAKSDVYGMLKGGMLQLQGKLKPGYTKNEKYVKGSQFQDRETVYSGGGTGITKIGEIRYDVPLCAECAPPG
ncbi:HET-domain-containing protein [Lojkania enalia]|uniref:HET-domain-containing protein n=1 Tax=Lojkania enalia TaxID=147567 RepID=A0A9P4KF44_9PLEO|nr:HET-domain-containing protein [Didymosphaeria enalia]